MCQRYRVFSKYSFIQGVKAKGQIMNYQDIKDSNERDCQMKQSQSQSNNNEPRCDEYGVEIREVRSSNQTHTQNNEITRK